MDLSLEINEIYQSVQGESSFIGLPCIFIRTMGCSLRCSYCDTEHAFYEGAAMSFEKIAEEIKKFSPKLVLLTGGEPLDQKNAYPFLTFLADLGYQVCLETSGARLIKDVDPRVHIILDLKTPSSLMVKRNKYDNLADISKKDEVKFVIGSEEDFEWSVEKVIEYQLCEKSNVLFSPVFGKLPAKWLAEKTIQTNLPIRFQLQLHKVIWSPDQKGV